MSIRPGMGAALLLGITVGLLSAAVAQASQAPQARPNAAATAPPPQAPQVQPTERAGTPDPATTFSAGQIQRWFEAYTVLQAQDALRLSESQYGRFVTRLKTLQEV